MGWGPAVGDIDDEAEPRLSAVRRWDFWRKSSLGKVTIVFPTVSRDKSNCFRS